jgi:peptidoglycan/LPS O-acetylase OafA/YrhL
MRDTPFITKPLSVALDLVRALAALAVLIGHSAQLGHYQGAYPFTIQFQHQAVIVFFVLSGLVIATSVDSGRVTLQSYTVARISRIVPVAVPALLLSALVIATNAALAPVPLFQEDARGIPSRDLLFALLFLSESYQTGLPLNPPYWSLCYEVWFYAMFAAATFLNGWKRVAWLAVLAVIAGPNVLLLLPVWLVGVALARLPAARAVHPVLGALFVMLAAFALYAVPYATSPLHAALRQIVPWRMGFSLYAISDVILALAIALGFAGLRTMTLGGLPWLDKVASPIRWTANMSFSLYLLHWPLLKLLRVLGMPVIEGVPGLLVTMVVVTGVSAAFASVTEHRRHAVRALIERALGSRRQATATA